MWRCVWCVFVCALVREFVKVTVCVRVYMGMRVEPLIHNKLHVCRVGTCAARCKLLAALAVMNDN